MTVTPSLIVSEIFGPTIQGEGRYAGRRSVFLRLGRCNLDCTWCDTPYTWDWDRYDPANELRSIPLETIRTSLDNLAGLNPAMLVVTGGEPLLQARNLRELLAPMIGNVDVSIETNGTRPPLLLGAVHYTLSPKLSTSGTNPDHRAVNPEWDGLDREDFDMKFVITSGHPDELDEVRSIVHRHLVPADRVWLMAEGTSSGDQANLTKAIAELAIANGWNYSPRLHVVAWGDRRGV